MTKTWLRATVGMAVALPASAHPGHGVPGAGESLLHYLGEPVHAIAIAAAIAGALAVGGLLWRRQAAVTSTRQR